VPKTLIALAIGCAGIAVSAAIQAFVIQHWHIVLFGSRLANIPYGAIALAIIPAVSFGFGAEYLGVRPGWRAWLSAGLLLIGCVMVWAPPALQAILNSTGKPFVGGGNVPFGRWWECIWMAMMFGAIAYTLRLSNYCEPCGSYFRQKGMKRYSFTSMGDCLAFYDPLWYSATDAARLKVILAQNRPTSFAAPQAAQAAVSLLCCPKCQQLSLFGKVLQKRGSELNVVENLTRQRVLGQHSSERSTS